MVILHMKNGATKKQVFAILREAELRNLGEPLVLKSKDKKIILFWEISFYPKETYFCLCHRMAGVDMVKVLA